jgi:CRISPR-associated protein Csm4
MDHYLDYTVEVELKSPIITAFQADTIFGHICWAVRFIKWNGSEDGDRLKEFLDLYDNRGQGPPLLVSDGFPKGYLPKPVLPPITQRELDGVVAAEDLVADSHKIKMVKKLEYMPAGIFARLSAREMDPQKVFETLYTGYKAIADDLGQTRTGVIQHNTVNRVRNLVTAGLYAQEENFCASDSCKFEIYIQTNHFPRKDLERIFAFIGEQGYGKDKSTGKGHFSSLVREGNELVEHKNPNGFMTLSSFVPTGDDPTEGYYRILHKYGKLGGLFAKGLLDRNPFKTPLIMFAAGSTFRDNEYHRGKTYGSLLTGVHRSDKIRHYAHAYPLGIRLKDDL